VTGEDAFVGEPKSDAGKRTITIDCDLWDEMKAFADRWDVLATKEMFHGADGSLLHHKAVNHTVSGAGERIGLDVNSHQLRHSAVSLLIDAGANPRQIQTFVGHSDIRMTLGTYGHLFDQSGQDLADIMKRLRDEHRNGS
jgi:integrase